MSESARSVLKHLYKEGRMTEWQYEKIDRNLKEQPHGEWKKVGGIFYRLKCSNCNFELKSPDDKNNFCPNCGSDNRKEGDEE